MGNTNPSETELKQLALQKLFKSKSELDSIITMLDNLDKDLNSFHFFIGKIDVIKAIKDVMNDGNNLLKMNQYTISGLIEGLEYDDSINAQKEN